MSSLSGMSRLTRVLAFSLVAAVLSCATRPTVVRDEPVSSAWFDKSSTKSTVLILTRPGCWLASHGTGFLLSSELDTSRPVVVTCSHVLRGKSEVWVTTVAASSFLRRLDFLHPVYVVCDGETSFVRGEPDPMPNMPSTSFVSGDLAVLPLTVWGRNVSIRYKLVKDSTYVDRPDLDIAAFVLPRWVTLDSGTRVVDYLTIPRNRLKYQRESEQGDNVYFTGYPREIGTGSAGLSPLVRAGAISWLRPGYSDIFLADFFSNDGASGSPVFTKCAESNGGARLVGMVFGHENDNQGQNIGLADCVWIDSIVQVADSAARLMRR